MRIPGAERAVIDSTKIHGYLLSAEHRIGGSKARFFARLGFNQRNWVLLRDRLQATAVDVATRAERTHYGQKFVVQTTLAGPNGRSAAVVVVWIILVGEDFPRFVTAYPGDTA